MIEAIIFDFDGVLCESIDVKKAAFRRLFRRYPEHLDKILDYHLRNGGISRFEKFRVIYRDILKMELTSQKSAELGKKFSAYSYSAVVRAPLVKGTKKFLEEYHRLIRLFIASGTPEEEMRAIVQKKGLTHYFRKVYGSPRSKYEIIKTILKENRLKAEQVVFVGDSINDYEGSSQAGVYFVGRIPTGQFNPFRGIKTIPIIEDMNQVCQILDDHPFLSASGRVGKGRQRVSPGGGKR